MVLEVKVKRTKFQKAVLLVIMVEEMAIVTETEVADLEVQILEMIITETTGTKINNHLEMKVSEVFLLKEVKTKTEEMTQ